MKKKYNINEIKSLDIDLNIPQIIFLNWDLWAGKTTISKYIIKDLLWYKWEITSPTYTYYNKIEIETKYWQLKTEDWKLTTENWRLKVNRWQLITVYHFDLYRIKSYDEFFAIWWEEIFDNNKWIIVVEWPEIIKDYYKPNLIINLEKTDKEDEREIEIIQN